MAAITVSADGAQLTYQAASGGGDTVLTGYRIHVRNGGVGSITATITAYGPCSQGFTHNIVVTIPAGEDRIITAPSADVYANTSDGLIHIGYSGVSSVTVGAFR